jgi:uncharacterized damage-inducible protein DinB
VNAHIDRLFRHLAWADARTIDALGQMHAPPLDALRLLGHLLAAERVWLRRMEGTQGDVPVWPSLGLIECTSLARRNHDGYAAFLLSLSDGSLARAVRYRNTKGEEFTNSIEDILLHVALHGAYHRGQVARIVRAEGGVPLHTDYIFFIRESA